MSSILNSNYQIVHHQGTPDDSDVYSDDLDKKVAKLIDAANEKNISEEALHAMLKILLGKHINQLTKEYVDWMFKAYSAKKENRTLFFNISKTTEYGQE